MNLDSIIDAINTVTEEPGDYIGPGGLLYCGKCNTPKQTLGKGIIEGKRLSIPCACRQAQIDEAEAKSRAGKIEELRALCLPVAAMREHTFKNADQADHIQKARRYVEQWDNMSAENIGLLLWGNTGTGKSYAAQCIANALIDRQIPVHYVTAVGLLARLMEKDTKRADYMEKLCVTPLLIIDDIGAERETPFSREQLCAVIDARGEARKPLVVTTNLTLAEMRESQDRALQRIFDRLSALCVNVAVIGKSRRSEIGAAKMEKARIMLST